MDMIEHRVRERAYYIWEGEGRVVGRADAHWLQAEAEFAAEAAPVAAARTAAPKTVRTKTTKVAAPKAAAKATTKVPRPTPAKDHVQAPAKPRRTPRADIGIALH